MTLSVMQSHIYKLANYLRVTPEDSRAKKEIKKAVKMDLENRYQDPQVE